LYNETGRSGNVVYDIKQTHDNVVKVRAENSITGVDAQQGVKDGDFTKGNV